MNSEIEEWKKVILDGKEWDYKISNHGNLRHKSNKKHRSLGKRGKYIACTIFNNSNRKTVYVHDLVACAFVPNDDPTKNEVNHINHDGYDNRASRIDVYSKPKLQIY